MSHFYGTIRGGRGEATRCGHKTTGLLTNSAGHHGNIRVHLYYDEEREQDRFEVFLTPWQGSGGQSRRLVHGALNSRAGGITPVSNALGAVQFALQTLERYNMETIQEGSQYGSS